MIRIAISGFGRIGRCLLRALSEHPHGQDIEVVGINDLADFTVLAHLLMFDSSHGHWPHSVHFENNTLEIDGRQIPCFANADPSQLPWASLNVDVVVECAGKLKSRAELAGHLAAGAPRVLASYPVADADAMVVYGVNHEVLDKQPQIVSNASCTTNCLAPIIQVLDQAFGVVQGQMTTIHSYTNDQNLVDKAHGDLYRARAAATNMIPTQTGAAAAVGEVLPHLKGKLHGMAVRVPILNVSLLDLHVLLRDSSSVAAIHQAFEDAAYGPLRDILAVNHLPLVSSDFNHQPWSAVVDSNHSKLIGHQLKLLAWYDNEWGFSNRLIDVIRYWRAQH